MSAPYTTAEHTAVITIAQNRDEHVEIDIHTAGIVLKPTDRTEAAIIHNRLRKAGYVVWRPDGAAGWHLYVSLVRTSADVPEAVAA